MTKISKISFSSFLPFRKDNRKKELSSLNSQSDYERFLCKELQNPQKDFIDISHTIYKDGSESQIHRVIDRKRNTITRDVLLKDKYGNIIKDPNSSDL